MLIDALREGKWLPDALHLSLREATVFEINDVANYVYDTRYDDDSPIYKTPPNIAPLGPATWFEWDRRILIGDIQAVGVLLVVSIDTHDDENMAIINATDVGRATIKSLPQGTRWLTETFFVQDGPDGTGMSGDRIDLCIAPDGSLLEATLRSLGSDELPDQEFVSYYQTYLSLVLLATCFAHCKGVTTTAHQQPRQQRRAAEREGRPPLVSYRTIDIAPVARILRDEGDIDHNGLGKALHITRGHFAHYTEDKPLFGKYVETFYRPMHVRGRVGRGVVLKDYSVTAQAANRQPQTNDSLAP